MAHNNKTCIDMEMDHNTMPFKIVWLGVGIILQLRLLNKSPLDKFVGMAHKSPQLNACQIVGFVVIFEPKKLFNPIIDQFFEIYSCHP